MIGGNTSKIGKVNITSTKKESSKINEKFKDSLNSSVFATGEKLMN